jgi:DNA repair exonuclease SbcCD ATPase subunit
VDHGFGAVSLLTFHSVELFKSPKNAVKLKLAPLRFGESMGPNEVQGNRRRPRTSRAQATTAHQQLRSAQTEIDALKADIQRLEHSGQELKNLVSKEKGLAKDAKVEAEGSNAELRRARERLDEMRVSMDALMREFNQYRGWWLTENRSLKVVLREVPKRKWNTGLQAIASSSHSRFMSYSGSGSN